MISLESLWNAFDLPENGEIKFYRHSNHILRSRKDPSDLLNIDIESLYANGELEAFQSIQGSNNLGTGYVAFFIHEDSINARFIGLWKILASGKGNAKSRFAGSFGFYDYFNDSDTWYELEKTDKLGVLVDRLIIKWPNGRAAHRWYRTREGIINDFEVAQIRGVGISRRFPGFADLVLSFSDLEQLTIFGDGGTGWIEALKSTRGVYLITDDVTGDMYVGSATGANGLWGRWTNYASTGHGGNLLIKAGLEEQKIKTENLTFHILQTLDNIAQKRDGIDAEIRWKRKLGKRATTLNAN